MFGVIRLQVLTPSAMVLATISLMEVQERQIDMCLLCSMHIYTRTDGWMFSTETIHVVHQSPSIATLGVLQGSSISSAGKASRVYSNSFSISDYKRF